MPTPNSSADTIRRLVRWFADPEVGAVAGNAKVGNRDQPDHPLAGAGIHHRQNLERRALGGARLHHGGARRGRRLAPRGARDARRLSADTLAEDQDLTIAVQKAGYTRPVRQQAIAWTEAPDTVERLWPGSASAGLSARCNACGSTADATLRPRYGSLGMVAMPQAWLFQIVLSCYRSRRRSRAGLAVWSLSGLDLIEHGGQFDGATLQKVLLLLSRLSWSSTSAAPRSPSPWSARRREPAAVARAAALRLSPADVLRRAQGGVRCAIRSNGRLEQARPERARSRRSTPLRLDRNAKAPYFSVNRD